ncbi:MAG: GLUG motif-containing protein [Candidatus Pacearchaeota archaeon]
MKKEDKFMKKKLNNKSNFFEKNKRKSKDKIVPIIIFLFVLLFALFITLYIWQKNQKIIYYPKEGELGTIKPMAGGSGTIDDPYIITNCIELDNIRNYPSGTYFALDNNISFYDVGCENYRTGAGWVPLYSSSTPGSPFRGHLDGRNFTIRGLYINNLGSYNGLFGALGSSLEAGEVKNLNLEDVYVKGSSGGTSTGGLAGLVNPLGSIYRVSIKGNVSGGNQVGLLAGDFYGSAEECSARGNVTAASEDGGGLIGRISGGNVINSYAHANVYANKKSGGFVGKMTTANVNNCYAVSNVYGPAGIVSIGGFGRIDVGYAYSSFYPGDDITILAGDVYKDNDATTPRNKLKENLISVDWLKSQGWDFNNVWSNINDGVDYPLLKFEVKEGNVPTPPSEIGNYNISNCQELQDISKSLKSNYTLINDIDCSGFNFIPIGNAVTPFEGVLDGNGHSILNFVYSSNDAQGIGIFYYVGRNGVIKNIGVTGSIFADSWCGGLVVYNYGNIINSFSEMSVRGDKNIGGLVSQNWGNITNCYSKGGIVQGRKSNSEDVGGLVGENYGIIKDSYSEVTKVNAIKDVGGFVGHNYEGGIIINCYSLSDVEGYNNVGGFIGDNEQGGSIINSYSAGSVTGFSPPNDIGGFIGKAPPQSLGTFINVFYPETTKITLGTNTYGVISSDNLKNISFLETNYSWSFPPWSNINDGLDYPKLAFQESNSINPIIILFPFKNYSAVADSVNIDFIFRVMYPSEIINCSVITPSNEFENKSQIIDGDNLIQATLLAGNYNVFIKCYTNNGISLSRNVSILINPPEPAISGGGGGGGGSGGIASSSYWKLTFDINPVLLKEGFTKLLKERERFRFKINGEYYYAGIINLTSNNIIMNISSKSFNKTFFNVGEEKKFDLNNDKYYDTYIKLNSIKNNYANITIKEILEKIGGEKDKLKSIINNSETKNDSIIVSIPEPIVETPVDSHDIILYILIFAIIAVVIAIIIAFLYFLKEKKR